MKPSHPKYRIESSTTEGHMDQVKALLFDVFGTVVDWRSSVISELEALGEKSGIAPGNY